MKKRKFWILIAALCLLFCIGAGSLCAFAETQPADLGGACLIVTGTASVEAKADTCTFNGNIEAAGNDMHTAQEKCAEIFAKAREVFSAYGSVREEHSSAYPNEGTGYTAAKYLTFITNQTDKAEEIRAALAKAGVSCLDGVCYSCKNDAQYKLTALQKAIEDARQKAAALGTDGKLVRVEETCCYPCVRNEGAEGTVTYNASVRAVFARLPQRTENSENKSA